MTERSVEDILNDRDLSRDEVVDQVRRISGPMDWRRRHVADFVIGGIVRDAAERRTVIDAVLSDLTSL